MDYQSGSFSNLPFSERRRYLGSSSEKAAEKYFISREIPYERYGFENDDRVKSLPRTLAQQPDYIAQQFGGSYFFEVKACGPGGFKVKVENIDAWTEYQREHPVIIFLWHGSTKRFALLTLGKIKELTRGLTTEKFPDNGKEYYTIPCARFNWQTL